VANAHGFSLHAGVRCAADQRQALEHLCRYVTRPAIANERLNVNRAGAGSWCAAGTACAGRSMNGSYGEERLTGTGRFQPFKTQK
jgi:hypothetical protein